jgi:ankyrin repeat protein
MSAQIQGTRTPRRHCLCAARTGHKEGVTLLMKNNVNPYSVDHTSWTPLWWAAALKHPEIIKMLTQSNLDNANFEWKVDGHTLLSWAALCGYKDILKIPRNGQHWP